MRERVGDDPPPALLLKTIVPDGGGRGEAFFGVALLEPIARRRFVARHVGKTDAELITRLRREPQISTASSYHDRATAERVVGAALASAGRSFDAWRTRAGPRPNFVLRYGAADSIGRSISRGRSEAAPCDHAVVVLRWDDRRKRFYVLTSYPEESR